jgi:hypothetical protein
MEKKPKKCSNCGETIAALSRVCGSCGFVMDSHSSIYSAEALEELIAKIEDVIVDLKTIKKRGFFYTVRRNNYIAIPLLTILSFGLNTYHVIFSWIGLVLFIISWKLIRIKLNDLKLKRAQLNYIEQLANAEKLIRRARTLFGEDRKVNHLIQDLEEELIIIKTTNNKGKRLEFLFYFLIATLIYFLFFNLPSMTFLDTDNKTIKETISLINTWELEKAEELAITIQFRETKVDLLSQIQLKKHLLFFDQLERDWTQLNTEQKIMQLGKAIWKQNSVTYDEKKIERNYFEVFVERKTSLNEQLPEKKRINFSLIL